MPVFESNSIFCCRLRSSWWMTSSDRLWQLDTRQHPTTGTVIASVGGLTPSPIFPGDRKYGPRVLWCFDSAFSLLRLNYKNIIAVLYTLLPLFSILSFFFSLILNSTSFLKSISNLWLGSQIWALKRAKWREWTKSSPKLKGINRKEERKRMPLATLPTPQVALNHALSLIIIPFY